MERSVPTIYIVRLQSDLCIIVSDLEGTMIQELNYMEAISPKAMATRIEPTPAMRDP